MPSSNKYQFFSAKELACKCGCGRGQDDMAEEFMQRLIVLRINYKLPMIISSAFRCPQYNSIVSLTGPHSDHPTGHAVDVLVYGGHAHKLLYEALDHDFRRIGISQTGNYKNRIIHISDLGPGKDRPSPWVWTY